MIRIIVSLLAAAALVGCAHKGTNAVQADMPMDKGTVPAGAGSSVKMKGNPLPLSGTAVVVGQPLPAAMVTGAGLKPVNLADGGGKVRIISVVPSIDTPTCDKQTHELSEKNGGLDKQVEMITTLGRPGQALSTSWAMVCGGMMTCFSGSSELR